MANNKPNYHSFLFSIAPKMDKVMSNFKSQETRANVDPHWFMQALTYSFKELKTFYKPATKINGLEVANFTSIPLIGGGIAGFVSFFQGLEWYWITLTLIGSIFLLLVGIMVPINLNRMLNLNHPYFYLPAYKTFRKNEFDLLNHTVHDKNISYLGLAEYVNGLVTKQTDELEIVKTVTEQYNLEKDVLRQEISQLIAKEENAIKTYQAFIEELETELQWYETAIDYFVQLFHELYVILHRIGKGNCHFSDLKIIAGFTLYKREGNKLTQIADEGTTGQNPDTIDLTRNNHNPWVSSIVEAAKKPSNLFSSEPKEGYFIVSYRMNIGNKVNETWIISLQIASSVNKRGYLLTLTNDIIDQRVIFNMIHGLCQIIYKNNLTGNRKGDGTYGKK